MKICDYLIGEADYRGGGVCLHEIEGDLCTRLYRGKGFDDFKAPYDLQAMLKKVVEDGRMSYVEYGYNLGGPLRQEWVTRYFIYQRKPKQEEA